MTISSLVLVLQYYTEQCVYKSFQILQYLLIFAEKCIYQLSIHVHSVLRLAKFVYDVAVNGCVTVAVTLIFDKCMYNPTWHTGTFQICCKKSILVGDACIISQTKYQGSIMILFAKIQVTFKVLVWQIKCQGHRLHTINIIVEQHHPFTCDC